jgi:hypothetical protein
MTQLTKQSNSIGSLITNLPKQNVSIYDAYKKSIRIMDFTTQQQMNNLVEALGKWSFYLGISDKINEKDLILNAQFIKENFGTLNLTDINYAIKMCTAQELDDNIEHFGKLSPLYIGKVLNSYKSKRNAIITEINRKVATLDFNLNIKIPSKEQRLSFLKNIIHNAWETVNKENKIYIDFGDCIYLIIKEKKLIKVNETLINDANEYAIKQINKDKRDSSLKAVINNINFHKIDFESLKKRKLREYIVNLWLSSMTENQKNEFIKSMK